MAIDRRIPCTRDCQNRSPECKASCKEWAVWEEIKRAEYAKRKLAKESSPCGPTRAANMKRKAMCNVLGRKR